MKFVKRWGYLNEDNEYVFRYFRIFWDKLVSKFPYLSPAFRRYIYYPENIILRPQHIKKVDLEKIVIGTIDRDFSEAEKMVFISKLKDFNKVILDKKGKGNRRLW